ncbi:MAG: GNAT family N-acetyltransferase [Bacteroidales bacterium]|jgi:uncharacterized protein
MKTSFEVIHNESGNRFEVHLADMEYALLIYMVKAGLFVITHTEVPPDYQGQGIAALLAQKALDYARDKGLQVRSYCSYTTWYIDKHPEYQNLLG